MLKTISQVQMHPIKIRLVLFILILLGFKSALWIYSFMERILTVVIIKNRLKLSQKHTTKCYKCQKCTDDVIGIEFNSLSVKICFNNVIEKKIKI